MYTKHFYRLSKKSFRRFVLERSDLKFSKSKDMRLGFCPILLELALYPWGLDSPRKAVEVFRQPQLLYCPVNGLDAMLH